MRAGISLLSFVETVCIMLPVRHSQQVVTYFRILLGSNVLSPLDTVSDHFTIRYLDFLLSFLLSFATSNICFNSLILKDLYNYLRV